MEKGLEVRPDLKNPKALIKQRAIENKNSLLLINSTILCSNKSILSIFINVLTEIYISQCIYKIFLITIYLAPS